MRYSEILQEQTQAPATRKAIFQQIQDELGKPVLSYFVNFHGAIVINDDDRKIIHSALQDMDLSEGLALIINAPGGDGLAAERIIKTCRSYSGTNGYTALVPDKAKSAATMICFGADEIYMGPTSELGPIDPQTVRETPEGYKALSARNVIESYKSLFKEAAEADGNLEPYLQQLERFDERNIKDLKQACDLSDDIAAQTLASGMMSNLTVAQVKDKIDNFTEPDQTLSHGRPIYREEADNTGLNINPVGQGSLLWELLQELANRTTQYLHRNNQAKSIEGMNFEISVPASS
jgi:hypothetical protein